MLPKEYKNKAIVIGTDNHNSLGVVRSLGKNGVTVELIVITNDISQKAAVEYSKYVNKSYRIDDYAELIPALLHITKDDFYHKSVVFTTSDTVAKLVDDNKDVLEETCIVPKINSKDKSLRKLLNKSYTNKIAKEAGLEVPSSIIIDLTNYSSDILLNIKYPCIVKPVCSFEGQKSDIRKFNNKSDLISYLEILKEDYKNIMLQEYIDGTDSRMVGLIGFVTQSGEAFITGIMDKAREYPLNTGSTSYGAFSENKFNLNINKVKKFIKKTGYYGIFDFDFKYTNGKSYFIEMNFRNGALSYASTVAGVNIIYLWYLDACGEDISKMDAYVDKDFSFMLEIRDFRHVFEKNMGLISWLKDLFRTDAFLVWDKTDIKPFIMKFIRRLQLY